MLSPKASKLAVHVVGRNSAIRSPENPGGRHLGFVRTGNSAIRSAVPKNPTLEPNRACERSVSGAENGAKRAENGMSDSEAGKIRPLKSAHTNIALT